MLGLGMSEFILIGVILCAVVMGLQIKNTGSSSFNNTLTFCVGGVILLFAANCFTSVPILGTIFLMPWDDIRYAQVANPAIRIVAFLIGGIFVIMGVFFQVRIGFNKYAKESEVNDTLNEKREIKLNLSGIKEAKDLLDSGAITEEEFKKIKSNYIGK
jgi:hypothetical protein